MNAVRALCERPFAGRLLAVRISSQLTDGLFQAALGGAILFNPERHADPLAVAGGLAVLLLPYSVIGPFAGALLDHWDRRTVLIWANLLRGVLICVAAGTIAAGAPDWTVLVAALAVTGSSRFVASGLSAALPHVALRERLVTTNAAFTTIGSGALALGAGAALGLRAIFGSDNAGSAATTLTAAALAVVAAAVSVGFGRLALGPDHPDVDGAHVDERHPRGPVLRAVAVGFAHGARAVVRTPTVLAALSAIGGHRLVFGLNTLMLLVLARHAGSSGGSSDGLAGIGLVATLTAVGLVAAAVVTPVSIARLGRRRTLFVALGVGLVAEVSLVSFDTVVICAAALVLGLIGQMAKLCGDAAMQLDTDDAVRGQVFSVQDAVFNVAYVAAVTVAALTIAPDGRSPLLPIVGAALYAVAIVVVRLIHPRHVPPPRAAALTPVRPGDRLPT